MRMLWVSLLLIGSITCVPQQPGAGQSRWWYTGSSSEQEPSKPVYQNPGGQVSGSGVYSSYPGVYYSSGTGGADGGSTHGVQQSGQQGAPDASSPQQFAEESWSSSSDTSGEEEPVFTPVDEEDQVYAYKSKSQYNRKQLRFTQFRYTPTEPLVQQPPVYPYPGKNPQHPGQKGH
uniref:Uncharacterized protein n=1 Tax=Fundulus heteroclitus TaxID=8078 RepID=A0A146YG06_FUNHE